ncbi:MAG: hypothetical protein JEZ06_15185 [Anaerolineaceae bacterium]|nr:hypothetical protein [Anaerolineaceae bacterium]
MSKKLIYGGIIGIVAIGIIAIAVIGITLLKKPLAPPLSIQTEEINPEETYDGSTAATVEPINTENQVEEIFATKSNDESSLGDEHGNPPENTPNPEAVPEIINSELGVNCGSNESYIILVSGIDKGNGASIQGADFIRLIKIDFSTLSIVSISLPKSVWVSGDTLASLNIDEMQLGNIYDYVYDHAVQKDTGLDSLATNYLAQTIFEVFDVYPRHYLSMDIPILLEMYTALGKITIENPKVYNDFPIGEIELDMHQVLEYIRYPEPNLSEQQIRQNLVIQGTHEKLLEPATLSKVPGFIQKFQFAVTTDLSPQQLLDINCLGQKIPQENIEFYELPAEYLIKDNSNKLHLDSEHAKIYIEMIMQ